MYLPTISIQTQYFFYSILLGIIIAIIYDIFRTFRLTYGVNHKSRFFLSDVCIMIVSAFLFFIYTLSFGYGKVRYYALVGAILGFVLYVNTFGVLTYKVEGTISKIIYKFIQIILWKPINIFVKALKKFKGLLYNVYVICTNKVFRRKTGDKSEEGKDWEEWQEEE